MEQLYLYWWDTIIVNYQEYWLYALGFIAEVIVILAVASWMAPPLARHLARRELEVSSRNAWLKYWLRDRIILDIEGGRLRKEISTNDAKYLYCTIEHYLPDIEAMKHIGTVKKEIKTRLREEHKIPEEMIPKKVEAMKASSKPLRKTKAIKL